MFIARAPGKNHENSVGVTCNLSPRGEKKWQIVIWVKGKFNWQAGFGVFSYGHSQIDVVVKYIQNQEEHHRKKTFKEEYLELLRKFNVEYDERYLSQWIGEEKD